MVNLDRGEFWIEDGAIASSYILLAAEQYDIGACWVHIRNRSGKIKSSDEEIRKLLNVPEGYAVLNLIALGGKGEIKKGYTEADFDFGTESYFNCDKAILSSIAVSIDLSELESFG